MAEATFSWYKLASFVGALVLVVLALLLIGGGIYQIIGGQAVYGSASIIGGLAFGYLAWWVYNNYQVKSRQA